MIPVRSVLHGPSPLLMSYRLDIGVSPTFYVSLTGAASGRESKTHESRFLAVRAVALNFYPLDGSNGVNVMVALLFIGLLAASGSVLANSFEFAGLSRATTLQDAAKRYPNSMVSGSYVYVSPKDTHDHIFGIELFGTNLSYRLRINFESPDRKYPFCEVIERSIGSRHGPPSEIREFREEAAQNRYLVWKLELETVQLQCFRFDGNARYLAEAIAVHPTEPKPAPSAER